MKRFSTLVFLFAVNYVFSAPLLDIMRKVNAEVDHQSDLPHSWKHQQVMPENFDHAIQIHLLHVEQVLRSRNTNRLSRESQLKRLELLTVLHEYALANKFPRNLHYSFQTPVFIDDFGTHCAVGFLMKQSGYEQLALNISTTENLAYVREITASGVAEWAQEHGFTINELAWIQPGYPPNTTLSPLQEGINGTVYSMTEFQNVLIAAGSFDTAGSMPASNIAMYVSGFADWLWTEMGGGINGTVKKLMVYNNNLIAAGQFSQAGNASVSNVAMYGSNGWEPFGTNINGEVRELLLHNNELYAFGSFQLNNSTGSVENAAKWDGTEWSSAGVLPNGPVNTAISTPEGIWLGGSFNSCNGVACNHLVFWNGSAAEDRSQGIYTIVYDIEEVNNEVFAAGKLKEGNEIQGVMKYAGNTWQAIGGISYMSLLDSNSIVKKLYNYNGRLMAAGNFNAENLMVFGKGLAIWQNTGEFPEPLTWLCDDESEYVEELFVSNGLYLGGSFASNFNPDVQGVVRLDGIVTGSQTIVTENQDFFAFPNPSGEFIELKNIENAKSVHVFDLSGRILFTHPIENGLKIQLPVPGSYILQTNTGEVFRVIRQP